ncbi:MAG: F0F1 ATP synthase subunit gamma [Candidatus Omnitrophica bacterium]|nr:F0F1 ATP synthase subunit gamma [Candidatus Omnitrophota bacterium]
MRPLVELRYDFDVTKSLGDIIDVLKTAALIQFRAFQLKQKPNEEYLKETQDCLRLLLEKKVDHPYLFGGRGSALGIVVITSDGGFLGELNTLLVNAALDLRKSKEDEIIVLGERGARYLEDAGEKFSSLPGISDEIQYKEVESLADNLVKGFRERFNKVLIIYPLFVSISSQRITTKQILPLISEEEKQAGEKNKHGWGRSIEEMLIEPSFSAVLEGLMEVLMGYRLMEIFWSSKQSEFAARIMHLEGSTQELNSLNSKLSFEYFRQVHALKDKVIREISASKLLLTRGKN